MQSMQHIPIFYMDVQGFTTHNTATQRTIIQRLQTIATAAARFFMPYGDPWAKWRRHGTGDGYYFVLDGLSPQVALQYAVQFDTQLARHNAQHGQDLALQLYGVLVLGDVELVGDQYLSEAFSEAARFLSHEPLKDYLQQQEYPMVLAMSALFHTEWRADVARQDDFPESAALLWTPFEFRDKHHYLHKGYVRGPGWRPQPMPQPHDKAASQSQPPLFLSSQEQPAVSLPEPTYYFSGAHKLAVCERLHADWQRLADVLDIPSADRPRFDRGREPHGIWEWLEARRRLHALPPALQQIGRNDLLELLQNPR